MTEKLSDSPTLVTEVAKELVRLSLYESPRVTRDTVWRPQRDSVKDGFRQRARAVLQVIDEVQGYRCG